MYTDPNRLRATDPGETDPSKNPLWGLHDAFNTDKAWSEAHKTLYATGKVGDVVIKKKLIEVVEAIVAPVRQKRKHFEARPSDVIDALKLGTAKANAVAEVTLAHAKAAMKQDYFARTLVIQ